MAKFCGTIGYSKTEETSPDVWTEVIKEISNVKGNVLKFSNRWEKGNGVNDDISISNKISIIADSFLLENIQTMRYVTWMGVKWKISDISVEYPRLIISLGGIFNE